MCNIPFLFQKQGTNKQDNKVSQRETAPGARPVQPACWERSEWLLSSDAASITYLNMQHTENETVFLDGAIHVVGAGLMMRDTHIECLQNANLWMLSQSECFRTALAMIIIPTAPPNTIHFTYTNTICSNSLLSALGEIKCRGKWRHLCCIEVPNFHPMGPMGGLYSGCTAWCGW